MGQILHQCGAVFCKVKIPMDKQYCPEHAKADIQRRRDKYGYGHGDRHDSDKRYNQTKRSQDKDKEKFYRSSKWRNYRKVAIARANNECAVCGDIRQDRKIVDHIYPYRLDRSLTNALGRDSTMVLCNSCHNAKTRLENMILDKPNGKDVMKKMSRDDWVELVRKYKAKNR